MSDIQANVLSLFGLFVFVLVMMIGGGMVDAYRERQVLDLMTSCVQKNPVSECKDLVQSTINKK